MEGIEKEISFLKDFAFSLGDGAQLVIDGEIGFARSCVGITTHGHYLDYETGEERWNEEIQANGPYPEDEWNAYHKGTYLAVLIDDNCDKAQAIRNLYDWCKKLERNGYKKVKVGPNDMFEKE